MTLNASELSQEDKSFLHEIRVRILSDEEPDREDIKKAFAILGHGIGGREKLSQPKGRKSSAPRQPATPLNDEVLSDLFKLD